MSAWQAVADRTTVMISVCPGQTLAENTVYIVAASLLACFDFLPPVDKNGKEVAIVPEFPLELQVSR